jgi:DNA helicase-2/ATP-dependent DNA helicase PcrA
LLLDKNDQGLRDRIKFKSSAGFIQQLDRFIAYIENEFFEPSDLVIKKRHVVPKWFIKEKFEGFHRLPLLKRLPEIVQEIDKNIRFYYNYEINAAERNAVRQAVSGMFKVTNVRELYKEFYNWLDAPHLLKPASRSRFEYADVFPLVYLKIRLEGSKNYDHVKHLLVDEMQDYTPIQYAVLSRLFACKKTILGDAGQSVNPFGSSTAETIQAIFPDADVVKLLKSYRSTYEITRFAQHIKTDPELIAIERHGKEPEIVPCKNSSTEIAEVRKIISEFRKSDYQSLGIICKTQKQATSLFEILDEEPANIFILDPESPSFARGVVVTTAHMAKGLEFDWVIVPQASAVNYQNTIEKNMLYIACTRAMHRLLVSHAGKVTDFIK